MVHSKWLRFAHSGADVRADCLADLDADRLANRVADGSFANFIAVSACSVHSRGAGRDLAPSIHNR